MSAVHLHPFMFPYWCLFFFFFNDTATTEIYTLSLHDALPISAVLPDGVAHHAGAFEAHPLRGGGIVGISVRSEEHTSELQSQSNLVCRLLLEKKKNTLVALEEHSTRISVCRVLSRAAPTAVDL